MPAPHLHATGAALHDLPRFARIYGHRPLASDLLYHSDTAAASPQFRSPISFMPHVLHGARVRLVVSPRGTGCRKIRHMASPAYDLAFRSAASSLSEMTFWQYCFNWWKVTKSIRK